MKNGVGPKIWLAGDPEDLKEWMLYGATGVVTNTAPTSETTTTLTSSGLTDTSGTPLVTYVIADGDILDDSAATNALADGQNASASDSVPPTITSNAC